MLQRRSEIAGQVKSLEQERQGIRAPGGWILQQRSRTSWDYAPEIREAIKGLQRQARDDRAQPLPSTQSLPEKGECLKLQEQHQALQ